MLRISCITSLFFLSMRSSWILIFSSLMDISMIKFSLMLSFPQSNPEGEYKYDESFVQQQKEMRVQLPDDTEEVFQEEQRLDQAWLWLLMGVTTFGVFIALLMSGQW